MAGKTIIITGASGGFGKAFTKHFLKAGFHVIAAIRNMEKKIDVLQQLSAEEQERVTVVLLDVADKESVTQFQQYLESLEHVDVLINNAGFAVAGFAEELTTEEYQLQFETNFFGVLRVTNAVLPKMRMQGYGRIINISSISGLIGFPGLSAYASSKYALEGYTESLRLEVKQFGVDVVLIEPGSFQTNIWSSGTYLSAEAGQPASPYKELFEGLNKHIDADSNTYGDPEDVARLAVKAAISPKTPSLRCTIGKGVKLSLTVKRLLPWKIWEKIVLKQLKIKK